MSGEDKDLSEKPSGLSGLQQLTADMCVCVGVNEIRTPPPHLPHLFSLISLTHPSLPAFSFLIVFNKIHCEAKASIFVLAFIKLFYPDVDWAGLKTLIFQLT